MLMLAVESLKICTLMGYFCEKYVMFELKKYRGAVSWKISYDFQNDIFMEFGEFSHKWFKVMLDKSLKYYVLAEEMYFLDKSSPSNFNFLDFSLLIWSFPSFSCDFWNQGSVFV